MDEYLRWAVKAGKLAEVLNVLKRLKAEDMAKHLHATDVDGNTLLHTAVLLGRVGPSQAMLICMLIDVGIDPELENKAGLRFLHLAAQGWKFYMLQILQIRNMDWTAMDLNQNTAQDMAAQGCEFKMSRRLRFRNIDWTATDSNQNTALHMVAAHEGRPNHYPIEQCIDILLEVEPPLLNARNKQGQTALHIAASLDSFAVVPLVEKHADPGLRDNQMNVPLHLAMAAGQIEDIHKCSLYKVFFDADNNCVRHKNALGESPEDLIPRMALDCQNSLRVLLSEPESESESE